MKSLDVGSDPAAPPWLEVEAQEESTKQSLKQRAGSSGYPDSETCASEGGWSAPIPWRHGTWNGSKTQFPVHPPASDLEEACQNDPFDQLSPPKNPGDEESDECVLERLRGGETRAMDQLWSRYAGLLYSQALRVLHNPCEAEDIVVEVFSEVWRRADRYHPERARPIAWLLTLVRRRAIDRYRERRSYEKAGERLARENHMDGAPPLNGTGEQVRLSDLRKLLQYALAKLPETQRQAVSMAYLEGLTQREISERTGTPVGTIKTRLELGLRKMRDRIRNGRDRPGTMNEP